MAPGAIQLVEEIVDFAHPVGKLHCTAPVPFGGEDGWLYIPKTKQFDLSRGSARKLVIASDEQLHNHRGFMINPEKTVLIVVDMQNYFIHPACRDHKAGIAAVKPTLKVIERCRQEGVQVAWLNWGITEHNLRTQPAAVQRGFCKMLAQTTGNGWHIGLGEELPNGQGRCLFKGTWNADLYPPLKAAASEQDLFFDKDRMSGLWSVNEPLHQHLRDSGKTTLLFAGVNTDQCLLGTLTDAYSYGWDCILLSDCSGTMTGMGAQALSEYQVAQNMGFVTDSTAFLRGKST